MAISLSTAFKDYVAVDGSVKDALDGGLIKFYDGTIPATADAAATGTLLWTVSVGGDGTGLTLDATAVDGAAVKPTGDAWQGATTEGTPTYWRFVAAGDTGASSTTEIRVQGSCGNLATSDIYLTDPVLTTDADLDAKILNAFSLPVMAA